MKNRKKKIRILICVILIIIAAIIASLFIENKQGPNSTEKTLFEIIKEEYFDFKVEEEEIPIEENQNFYTFLDTIKNIEELSSASINLQTKFISVEDDTYKSLLTCSLIGNVENVQSGINCKGIITVDMENVDVNISFPTYIKNLGTDDYSLILEVPSAYKKAFSMSDEERYLKINKSSKEELDKIFEKVKEGNTKAVSTEEIEIEKFKNIIDFTPDGEGSSSGIYDIEFNKTALLALFKQISNNKNYNDNVFLSLFIKSVLKDEQNIENIHSMRGQIAVSKGIATDIYFEVESETTSMIAFRMTLSQINNVTVEEEEYHSNEIKLFNTFIETLFVEQRQGNEDKTITIGNIYFTGADESLKIDTFTADMLNEPINVYINYSKCSIKTNLVVRWFYENQSIQLVENKLNNGEYEEGILKSSITFNNPSDIPKGKYRVEVYIDGQDKCYGKAEFKIE